MRLTTFLLLFSVLQVLGFESYSQSSNSISLNLKSASLKTVLSTIERETDYYFLYSPAMIDTEREIDVNVNGKNIKEVLDEIFKNTGIYYDIKGRHILLSNENIQPNDQKKTQDPHLVQGTVTSSAGEPIPGVTIIIKGTSNGTITDTDGNYMLKNVNDNATVVFSFVGMETKEVPVNGKSLINISLNEKSIGLDNIVVIGYGAIPKSGVTGAMSSVSSKTLEKIPVTTVGEALAGKMAGVQVTTSNGGLDADINIRVRGGGSITQDNSPLYLVDGFPVDDLSMIPLNDIESIDVLKEASTTAIYGARGANGVIIITTKSPKDKTYVQFNTYTKGRTLAKKLHVLDNYEFVNWEYEYQLVRNGDTGLENFISDFGYYDDIDIYKSIKTTDWQEDILGGMPLSTYYNLSVGGGSKRTKYKLSMSLNDDEGQLVGTGLQRYTINLKVNHQLAKCLKVEANATYSNKVIDGSGTGGVNIVSALRYRPTNGLSDLIELTGEEENYDEYSDMLETTYAPSQEAEQNYRKRTYNIIDYKGAIEWNIFKPLTFRSEFGFRLEYQDDDRFYGSESSTASSSGYDNLPSTSKKNKDKHSYRLANTLTYKQIIGDVHDINFLIGQEITHSQYNQEYMSARYFPETITAEVALANYSLGTPYESTTFTSTPDRVASFFGRAMYNYDRRYYVTLTMRADGSTKFAPGNQWGYFPAGSFAWRINNEDWFGKYASISNLKLRVGFGSSGNNRIDSDLWRNIYTVESGSTAPEFNNEDYTYYESASSYLYDPDLKWETTITRNIGVDFGFFDDRLNGTVDVYYNTTKDLLVPSDIPNSSGYTKQMTNIGQTSNKGIELSLDGTIIKRKDFNLSASFNIARNKNRVDKLASGEDEWQISADLSNWSSTYDYKMVVGETMGLIYGYVNDGFYTVDDFDYVDGSWVLKDGIADNSSFSSGNFAFKPGAVKFKKLSDSDDTAISEDDMTVIGNTNPKFTGGFAINADYKNFDFSAAFNFMYGFDVFNVNKLYLSSVVRRNYSNIFTDFDLAHRFRYVNDEGVDVSDDPDALTALNENATTFNPQSLTEGITMSYLIEDGSFLRLNTLTVGYTFSGVTIKKFKISKLRLYLTGTNLFTLTHYSGYDPEVNIQDGTTPGIDYNTYPRSRTFTIGANLNF